MTNVMQAINSMMKLDAPNIDDIEAQTDEFFSKADVDNDMVISL